MNTIHLIITLKNDEQMNSLPKRPWRPRRPQLDSVFALGPTSSGAHVEQDESKSQSSLEHLIVIASLKHISGHSIDN